MRGLFQIQVIGAAAVTLFARLVAADDWPYYQHDAAHTGNSSALVTPKALYEVRPREDKCGVDLIFAS